MTPWIKQSLVGLCGAALIAAAATVVADRDRGHGDEGAHGCNAGWMHDDKARAEHRAKRVERISAELGLNDAQKQKLSAFFENLSEQRKAMMGDRKGRHEKIQSLIEGTSFDRERAQALLNEKAVSRSSPNRYSWPARGDGREDIAVTSAAGCLWRLGSRRGSQM